MKINLRVAVENDMPKVLNLIKELAVFEKEPDAVVIDADELKREGFGAHPLFTCFLAEVENEVVGMALVYFRFSTWSGKTIHLEDLVVTEKMRGKGVGEALYKRVMQYGKEHKVRRVQWVVLDWNEGAIKFYEKTGATMLKDWYLARMDEKGIDNYLNS